MSSHGVMQIGMALLDRSIHIFVVENLKTLIRKLSCFFSRWQKLIQRPYENGDERGLKLVKAILRPLMLRRTKETKDKMGKYAFSCFVFLCF
jgi:SNF2 family DNA or RNA helicase